MSTFNWVLAIVTRDYTDEYLKLYRSLGVQTVLGTPASGTASRSMLHFLGLEASEKTILMCACGAETEKRLMHALKTQGEYEKAPKADIAFCVANCDDKLVRDTVSKLRKKNIVVQIFGGVEELTEYCNEKGIRRAILFDGDAIELTFSSKGDKI